MKTSWQLAVGSLQLPRGWLRSAMHLSTFSLFHSFALSQDIHFSQFHLSPVTLNPALTGAIDDDQRFTET
jgi:hypothetical protein